MPRVHYAGQFDPERIALLQEWFGYSGAARNLLEPIDYGVVSKSDLPRGGAQSHAVQNAVLGRPLASSTNRSCSVVCF